MPRADGTCPVCICDGVALTDCGAAPSKCSEGCEVERGTHGCLECSCRRRDAALCPPLDTCPEACQQLTGDSGCPECICDVPKPVCPFIQCPEDCRIVEQEGGCISCRCDPPGICPAIPECLRGCINQDEESECFNCNCTAPPRPPPGERPGSPSFILFPGESPPPSIVKSIYLPPAGSLHPSSDLKDPAPQCAQQPDTCPADCRVGVTLQGCCECHCGDNALLCPGVEPCPSRCQIIDTGNGCRTCLCLRRTVRPQPLLWRIFRSTFLPPSFNRP